MKTRLYLQKVALIPAYQPRQVLLETAGQLTQAGLGVVVVDDGSGEDFTAIFAGLPKSVHFVRHDQNRGKGAALKTGYRYIQKNFGPSVIITADADGQHKVKDIIKMAEAYDEHQGVLLLGVRQFEQAHVPLRSRFGNVLTRNVLKLITKRNLSDTQTGLRAFSSDLIDFMTGVHGDRFEYETNVLLECSRQGIEVAELGIETVYENNNDSSHFNAITDSWAIYKEILKFASSSLVAFAVDYLLFILLVQLTGSWGVAASVTFANIAARVVSSSVNFSMNRRLVFRHDGNLLYGAAGYFSLVAAIMIGNTLVLALLTTTFGVAPYLAKIITEIAFFVVSYVVQRKLIFRKKED